MRKNAVPPDALIWLAAERIALERRLGADALAHFRFDAAIAHLIVGKTN